MCRGEVTRDVHQSIIVLVTLLAIEKSSGEMAYEIWYDSQARRKYANAARRNQINKRMVASMKMSGLIMRPSTAFAHQVAIALVFKHRGNRQSSAE